MVHVWFLFGATNPDSRRGAIPRGYFGDGSAGELSAMIRFTSGNALSQETIFFAKNAAEQALIELLASGRQATVRFFRLVLPQVLGQ